MKRFRIFKQSEAKDCGPTCLKMVARHYGKTLSIDRLRQVAETTREGSSLLGISEAAEQIGFKTLAVKLSTKKLIKAPLPCILHWSQNHYVILYKIKQNRFFIADPAHGLIKYSQREFIDAWIGKSAKEDSQEGIALMLEPTIGFNNDFEDDEESKYGFGVLTHYIKRHRNLLWQLVLGLLAASLLQLVVPFLTQSVVDIGIKNQDIGFIYLVLFAQLAVFLGRTVIEVIRSWILLHLSTRINISLVSDFFIKLMKLPIAYFDSRVTGDILQRINDHRRIEQILTTSSLSVLFGMFNLIIFSIVLAYYSWLIFGIFMAGSALYFLWIAIFLKKRRDLDYKRFSQVSQEQSKVIEIINGMQDIKLHNAERRKRWNWEYTQARLFKVAMEGLRLEQFQGVGSGFINELKNIFITIISATLVISGDITLGMMLAITYIVGQLNAPIGQLINYVRELQDARISLERLGEIHDREDEEPPEEQRIMKVQLDSDIILENVSFRYMGSNQFVLEDLDMIIPANKVTAIVGTSGSGKTTLMKMLLKFYEPQQGTVYLGNQKLHHISHQAWRDSSGTVMQEGYIFNDTIAYNIAVGEDYIDQERLERAISIANIKDFIEMLPLSYNTKIGQEGTGLSTGQKQRLLIARAVYKNPDFLFFDEATSALDANNEKIIMNNLNQFFKDKTVLIIAHRLSTVKNADQIVVLSKGRIIETGNHQELTAKKGAYYELVKNQLELGN
ncbi:peptidase domain-containing ABC transporter [Nonlabens xiamenensis]|uniref:peptidase domain-containing ABC transporter n=1 Tax=Nonlabens xiamenensis TaxID=2341043 RepID=UPI000F60C3B0|nr:peptidase domain-containing ABC transporter [Nonlabens xiamenensis]